MQWQPDGVTIHSKQWFLGAGFLGAPPISLTVTGPQISPELQKPACRTPKPLERHSGHSDSAKCRELVWPCFDTANLRTKILDLRGFDSSIILVLRGGMLMSIREFTEILSQQILVGMILVGRSGVCSRGDSVAF